VRVDQAAEGGFEGVKWELPFPYPADAYHGLVYRGLAYPKKPDEPAGGTHFQTHF
jgi:hypothetical protein